MPLSRPTALFRRTRSVEAQIDEFLDRISEAGLVFRQAVEIYLKKGACDAFEAAVEQIKGIERRGDELRRSVETQLYEQTLIPDLSGDVLSLLEHLDRLINLFEANGYRFSIEAPEIPGEYHADFISLTETVVACVESAVLASRAFFRNIEAVRDHSHKVVFYETEADKITTRLKREIFASELSLERKIHLRHFVEWIDQLADDAEDIADRLAIYTIKRSI